MFVTMLYVVLYRYWMIPGFLLKRMVLNNFSREQHDIEITDSIDFIVERVRTGLPLVAVNLDRQPKSVIDVVLTLNWLSMATNSELIFVYLQLESLHQSDLASRLTLNCISAYVEPQKLHGLDITLIDVSVCETLLFLYFNFILLKPQIVAQGPNCT